MRVESDLLERIKVEYEIDLVVPKLLAQVRDDNTRRPYLPSSGGLRKKLLRETRDSPWAGHPGGQTREAATKRVAGTFTSSKEVVDMPIYGLHHGFASDEEKGNHLGGGGPIF
ncbi:hypothetical protein ACLOJK_034662 [Asimina triloba]